MKDSSILTNLKAELQQKIANGYLVEKLPYIIAHIEKLEKDNQPRQKLLLKMTRFYHSRHCMVEGGYIKPEQFCEELLDMLEGITPTN